MIDREEIKENLVDDKFSENQAEQAKGQAQYAEGIVENTIPNLCPQAEEQPEDITRQRMYEY